MWPLSSHSLWGMAALVMAIKAVVEVAAKVMGQAEKIISMIWLRMLDKGETAKENCLLTANKQRDLLRLCDTQLISFCQCHCYACGPVVRCHMTRLLLDNSSSFMACTMDRCIVLAAGSKKQRWTGGHARNASHMVGSRGLLILVPKCMP